MPGLVGIAVNFVGSIMISNVHKLPKCRSFSFECAGECCVQYGALAASTGRKPQCSDFAVLGKPEEGCYLHVPCLWACPQMGPYGVLGQPVEENIICDPGTALAVVT